MKKSILLMLCCLFIFTFQSLSQDSKVVWGNADEKTEKMLVAAIVGKDETGIYLFVCDPGLSPKNLLVKYDLNMNHQWSTLLEVKFSKRTLRYAGVAITHNKIILFLSDYDKKTQLANIYATTISRAGVIDPNYKEILVLKNVVSQGTNIANITFDEVRSLICITSNSTDELKSTTQLLYMNENFVVQGKKEFEEPIIEGNLQWQVTMLDSNYNAYSAYSTIENPEDKNSEKKCYLMTFNQSTKEKKEYELAINNYEVSDLYIAFDTLNGRYIRVFGYYADKEESALVGTFLFKIDLLSKKIESVSIKPFDASLVNLANSINIVGENSNNKKKESAFKDYNVYNVFENENDEMVVVSQQNNTTHSTAPMLSNPSGGSYSVPTYHFGNILITTFAPMGNVTGSILIPKYQKTTQYDGGSIGSFLYNGEVYIMYIDNPQNGITLSPNQYTSDEPFKSAFVCIKINKQGKAEKSIIVPAPADKKGILINATLLKVIDNDLFLIGHEDGKYKIGKMSLK